MDTGRVIRERRQAAKLSHDKLAALAGVSKRSLIYWEKGEREISVANMEKVLGAMGCELKISELLCT